LRDLHHGELDGLVDLAPHFEELAELVNGLAVMGELTPQASDVVSSYGERISSFIVTALFNRLGIDAVTSMLGK
jgi:aspartokinase